MCGSAQYGIASWSFSCGKPRIGADVYTRVDKYLDWINATINSLDLNFEYRSNVKRVDTNMDYYMNPDIDISSKQQSHIHANYMAIPLGYTKKTTHLLERARNVVVTGDRLY
ncbi:hypothetical protein CBL_03091 [Carabus blaptoides fortunei]